MKQDLPNLVDERRFKRREPPEPVERDEYGRVSSRGHTLPLEGGEVLTFSESANGPRSESPSI